MADPGLVAALLATAQPSFDQQRQTLKELGTVASKYPYYKCVRMTHVEEGVCINHNTDIMDYGLERSRERYEV